MEEGGRKLDDTTTMGLGWAKTAKLRPLSPDEVAWGVESAGEVARLRSRLVVVIFKKASAALADTVVLRCLPPLQGCVQFSTK